MERQDNQAWSTGYKQQEIGGVDRDGKAASAHMFGAFGINPRNNPNTNPPKYIDNYL